MTPSTGRAIGARASRSLLGRADDHLPQALPPEALVAQFRSLIYPGGGSAGTERFTEVSKAARKPRHILIVSLETAPRKYYPIIDNPSLPNFYRMSQRAIVSDMHYCNTPFTTWANFAILSGTYPMPGKSISAYGRFSTDGLANVLGRHGYESTYIDSYLIDWHPGDNNRRTVESLGFERLVDQRDLDAEEAPDREKQAMKYAQERLLDAHRHGQKALIFVATMRGHFPWRPRTGDSRGPSGAISDIALEFDSLFGSLLDFMAQHSLLDDVIVVVTGDHGLRYRKEYDSLGEEMKPSDVAFNVPFLLYAPGLMESQLRLPYVTSHVDITPSLLDLVAIPTESMVHHGESFLNPKIRDRVVFMMNTGLIPIDGFHWNGYFFTYNRSAAVAEIATKPDRSDARRLSNSLEAYPGIPKALLDPRQIVENANRLFSLSAAHQLAREGHDVRRSTSAAVR